MLYESRFTFPFSWLVGKRLEGMGELHFTTEKKIREHLLESFQDLPHAVWMKPPWNGRGRVYCFVFQFFMCFFISYYLFLGVADKNLTIVFTNTKISWNHMSQWHFRRESLSVVMSLCPVRAQKWAFPKLDSNKVRDTFGPLVTCSQGVAIFRELGEMTDFCLLLKLWQEWSCESAQNLNFWLWGALKKTWSLCEHLSDLGT